MDLQQLRELPLLGIDGGPLLVGRYEDRDVDISLELLFECLSFLLIKFALRLAVTPLGGEAPAEASETRDSA
jgi:hypothetical protein